MYLKSPINNLIVERVNAIFRRLKSIVDHTENKMSSLSRIIILLRKRIETIIYVTLWTLLILFNVWSLRHPNRGDAFTEEVIMNKIDTTNFSKEQKAKSWRESNIKFTEIDSNLDTGNSVEEKKAEKRDIDRKSSKDILVRKSPIPKKSNKSKSNATKKADPKTVSNKKITRESSPSEKPLALEETGFGYLTIILGNAHEYGYGYVVVDDKLWQQGEHNTTPLKIKLPVGNHKVEVKRDGFVSSPVHVTIFIEKNVEKQVSFALIPEKN